MFRSLLKCKSKTRLKARHEVILAFVSLAFVIITFVIRDFVSLAFVILDFVILAFVSLAKEQKLKSCRACLALSVTIIKWV